MFSVACYTPLNSPAKGGVRRGKGGIGMDKQMTITVTAKHIDTMISSASRALRDADQLRIADDANNESMMCLVTAIDALLEIAIAQQEEIKRLTEESNNHVH